MQKKTKSRRHWQQGSHKPSKEPTASEFAAIQCNSAHNDICFFSFFFLYFKVRDREPAVTHRTVCAASSPGSTDLYDVQPNPADLSCSKNSIVQGIQATAARKRAAIQRTNSCTVLFCGKRTAASECVALTPICAPQQLHCCTDIRSEATAANECAATYWNI